MLYLLAKDLQRPVVEGALLVGEDMDRPSDWTARWWDPRTGTWLPGAETVDAARAAAARADGRGFVLAHPCPDQDAVFLLEG
jgi:hypothetical protein